jgi:hypothetical protein
MTKMKKILTLIFALITVNTFSQKVYESSANGFKITLPESWEIEKSTNAIVDFTARYDINTSVNVVVKQSPAFEGLTIEQAADDNFKNSLVQQYSEQFKGFNLIESGLGEMGTYKAFIFKYSCDNPNGGILFAKQYFLISNSKLYILSTGCSEKEYSLYEPLFDTIVNSFTLN